MEIGCLVVSHKRAKVEDIEKLWTHDYSKLLSILKSDLVSEYAFLLTCNRFEVYAVGNGINCYLNELARKLKITEISEIYTGDECLEHILRVSCGLESMIVGEDQILGQVRHYYNVCKDLGITGPFLDRIFMKAIQAGRRVRKETKISKGSVSIGSAAIELAEGVLGSLDGKRVLLVGAGEMGEMVAKALLHKKVDAVLIANRTFSRAEELAKRIGGIAVRFDKLEEYMRICDVVISATAAPHTVILRETVERVMSGRDKLLIIDIALPRDVEEGVKEVRGVTLYTIDDLRKISEENLMKRLSEVRKAEKIIREELNQLKLLLKDIKAGSAIAAMYTLAERFVDDEVSELYSKLTAKYKVDSDVKDLLYSFANSLIKKFLREPTVRLREAARDGKPFVIDAALYLFGDRNVSKGEVEKIKKGQLKTDCKGS